MFRDLNFGAQTNGRLFVLCQMAQSAPTPRSVLAMSTANNFTRR